MLGGSDCSRFKWSRNSQHLTEGFQVPNASFATEGDMSDLRPYLASALSDFVTSPSQAVTGIDCGATDAILGCFSDSANHSHQRFDELDMLAAKLKPHSFCRFLTTRYHKWILHLLSVQCLLQLLLHAHDQLFSRRYAWPDLNGGTDCVDIVTACGSSKYVSKSNLGGLFCTVGHALKQSI